MDAERWNRVRALFDQLIELPREQWQSRLAEACGGDAALEREVLDLLAADTGTRAEPSGLAAEGMALLADLAQRDEANERERLAGTRLGPFRLLHRIGSGGMGAVWLAERADGEFAQKVAIKLIRSGWDEAEVDARFRAERQILAGLQHPRIAHLIDGGVTPDGKPWLALEYVDGIDLARYGERHRLDLKRRLELFLAVCEAVAYAHARLVVHRDLKPSNILVCGDGSVKLLDFGIAKLIDAQSAQASMTRVFTPEYAAPEQVRGEPVTTAVDVYALGLLLYELLTGRRPYRPENATPAAYERAVLEQAPTRPSHAVTRDDADGSAAALSAQRRLTPQRLKRELRGDLDAIVLKALRKEPAQRYASVQDFAADLRAWLQHRPVAARRGGWRYGAARFLRRHALAAGMALFAATALLAGFVIAVWQARQASLQRDMAVAESVKSRAVLEFMGGLFELADPDKARGEKVTAQELLVRGTERIRDQLSEQPAVRAELLSAMAGAQLGLGVYDQGLLLAKEASGLARATGDAALHRVAELRHARALHHLGRYREVLDSLDPLRETLTQPDRATETLRAEVDFRRGLALQAVNELEDADHAYASAHAAQLRLHGAADRRTQVTAFAHVSLLVLRGRMPEAERRARATLEAVRRSTSETDPHRARALDALAMVVANTGPLSEAEALRREELRIRQAVLGPEHPDTIATMADLATVLHAQRDLATAARMYRAVLRHRRVQLGNMHPSIATTVNNLAVCELELGELHTARDLAEEALRIRRTHYGPHHHTTAISFHALGVIEIDLGVAAAVDHLRQAVESYDAAMGADSGSALGALRDLARAQVLLGPLDASCGAAERALGISTMREGDEPSVAYTRAMLAACRVASGRAEDSAALTADLQTLRKHWGADDKRTRKIAVLAQAADRSGRGLPPVAAVQKPPGRAVATRTGRAAPAGTSGRPGPLE
ncbi:protein kinase domain-containing protein [Luteimonas salinilitoris]|uniref:Protein kinase n=1 Tax=Luteimonas salinilitoris TaxID=3237697 RepID=A0ABV4HTC2_9GAMM